MGHLNNAPSFTLTTGRMLNHHALRLYAEVVASLTTEMIKASTPPNKSFAPTPTNQEVAERSQKAHAGTSIWRRE